MNILLESGFPVRLEDGSGYLLREGNVFVPDDDFILTMFIIWRKR